MREKRQVEIEGGNGVTRNDMCKLFNFDSKQSLISSIALDLFGLFGAVPFRTKNTQHSKDKFEVIQRSMHFLSFPLVLDVGPFG